MKKLLNIISIVTILFICSALINNDIYSIDNQIKLVRITEGEEITNLFYQNNVLVKTVSSNPSNNYSSVNELVYEKNKLKKRMYYDLLSSGKKENIETITYNYNGNLISDEINRTSDNTTSSSYKYNSDGRLINKSEFNAKGVLQATFEYSYYSNGNLQQEIETSGTDIQATLYKAYDTRKNPFKQIYQNELAVIDLVTLNNLLSFAETTFEYEYNKSDFPNKIVERENGVVISTKILEYQ